jgi:hypothetical protein
MAFHLQVLVGILSPIIFITTEVRYNSKILNDKSLLRTYANIFPHIMPSWK